MKISQTGQSPAAAPQGYTGSWPDRMKKRPQARDRCCNLRLPLEMLYHLGPLNQNAIGKKLLISKSNMVAVIDKLEKRGLVRRERSREDRRCIFVHLTENGRDLIQQLLPAHVAAITEEMRYLSAEEQEELGQLCRKLGLKGQV